MERSFIHGLKLRMVQVLLGSLTATASRRAKAARSCLLGLNFLTSRFHRVHRELTFLLSPMQCTILTKGLRTPWLNFGLLPSWTEQLLFRQNCLDRSIE